MITQYINCITFNIINIICKLYNIIFVYYTILIYTLFMNHHVNVSIPIDTNISYSLFAQGLLIDIPQNDDVGNIIFKFKAGSVIALFYTFANFRRAYLVTEWQNQNDGEAILLPGIDLPLIVLFKAKGRRIDELKHALHILTKDDRHAPFKLPLEFWQKLSNLLELKRSYKEEVFYLYNKYTKGKKLK